MASIQEDSFTLEFKNITSEQLNNSLASALHSCSGKSVVLDFYDADKSLFPESTTCLLSSVSCVKGLILPKNTVKVPALADFKSLETVIIPETVTDISTSAFARCNSLKNFCFADSSNIIEIPSYMFQGCEALETITIPASKAPKFKAGKALKDLVNA